MKNPLKLLPLAAAMLIAVGCSSIPQQEDRQSLNDLQREATSDWTNTPGIVYRSFRQTTELLTPQEIPQSVYDMPVEISLSERITVDELASVLDFSGVQVVLATDEMADMSIFLPRYRGSFGGLVSSLSAATNLSFSWSHGMLVIDADAPYMLRIPQNEDLAEAITGAIGQMGAQDVEASLEAGVVSYRASNRDQTKIAAYLDRLSVNTSMVNLQVAVLNVSLDEQQRRGLDWSALSVSAGKLGLLENGMEAVSSIVNGAEDVAEEAASQIITGAAARASGSGIAVVVQQENVSLEGVLNMLSTYGDSKTMQNLTLKTLSGVPVELRSGQSIPYVGDVSLSVNERNATSGVSTETVDTGFEVAIAPFYDAEDELVTIDLELTMKSLIGFRELSAGDQIGTLSRPEIQDQFLKNIARLQAGETALIGGLVYESVSDNRTSLAGMERLPIGSKALRTSKNAMFVLIRPTVVVYGPRQTTREVN